MHGRARPDTVSVRTPGAASRARSPPSRRLTPRRAWAVTAGDVRRPTAAAPLQRSADGRPRLVFGASCGAKALFVVGPEGPAPLAQQAPARRGRPIPAPGGRRRQSEHRELRPTAFGWRPLRIDQVQKRFDAVGVVHREVSTRRQKAKQAKPMSEIAVPHPDAEDQGHRCGADTDPRPKTRASPRWIAVEARAEGDQPHPPSRRVTNLCGAP